MRKVILLIVTLFVVQAAGGWTCTEQAERQAVAHEIAELARSLGLPEDDPIIERARELWWEAEEAPTYSDEDLRILATVIWYEAPYCTDRHQQLVAQVVLNRVNDARFPDTVRAVVDQPGQYTDWYSTAAPDIPERCYDNARAALEGRVECPANVIFQAEGVQGTGVYEEIHVDTGWYSSTTYFCYG